jgi:hypothetical protein
MVSVPRLAKNAAMCTDRFVHHHIMIGRCRGLSSELGMRINLAFWRGREPAGMKHPEARSSALHAFNSNAPINEETGRGC